MPSRSERLSAADAALCRRERALPGLAGLLQAPALAEEVGIGAMRQSYLRFKPGTSCVAGLIPKDGRLDAWTAMTYPAERWEEVRARTKWRQRGAIFMDRHQIALVPLSLERRLKSARAIADIRSRLALLEALGLGGAELRILRYKPGRRLVLRADVAGAPVAVVKLHASSEAFARAEAGARHAVATGGPAVSGVDPDLRAIAVAWTPGRALSHDADPSDFALAGAALAMAHASAGGTGLAEWRPADPTDHVAALSALSADLGDLAAREIGALPPLEGASAVPLHGDFSADQVIVGPLGATLVDRDRAASGPAARDLGSALARLDLDAVRGAETGRAVAGLLEGYASVGRPPDLVQVAAHRAHALLALAVDGFRARRPDWDREAEAVIERVMATVAHAASTAPMPGLARALDGPAMAPLMPDREGIPSVALTRLKPGRRAMLRYAFPDGRALRGKLRAKGTDGHAPRVQAGLRAAGLDGRAGVGVPAVAGTLADPPLWLQEDVAGRSLADLIGAAEAPAAMRRTGAALAELHETPPQTEVRWTPRDEVAVLARAVAGGLHADLADLAAAAIAGLPPAPEVGLHRDFYFDQVIVAPETIWLVDLDLHARGDAAVDLGNFIAHLTELGLRHGKGSDHHARLGRAFLDGYATRRMLPPRARIDVLHWVSLARHVSIAARFPRRAAAVPALAVLCRDRLGAQTAVARAAM